MLITSCRADKLLRRPGAAAAGTSKDTADSVVSACLSLAPPEAPALATAATPVRPPRTCATSRTRPAESTATARPRVAAASAYPGASVRCCPAASAFPDLPDSAAAGAAATPALALALASTMQATRLVTRDRGMRFSSVCCAAAAVVVLVQPTAPDARVDEGLEGSSFQLVRHRHEDHLS